MTGGGFAARQAATGLIVGAAALAVSLVTAYAVSELARRAHARAREARLLAQEAEDAQTELVASQARLVTADDDARRRIVRDLHDGAQQRFVHSCGPCAAPGPRHSAPPAMADTLSLAFLVLLASLSPEQRAAFLLREVFDEPYDRIAEIIGTSEQNARQLTAGARRHVDERLPRFETAREQREQLATQFRDGPHDREYRARRRRAGHSGTRAGRAGSVWQLGPASVSCCVSNRRRS